MSEQNERDTHFAGAAKLLYDEIEDILLELEPDGRTPYLPLMSSVPYEMSKKIKQLLVHRAYDLAYHTLMYTTQAMAAACSHHPDVKEELKYIPDLTEWPEIY